MATTLSHPEVHSAPLRVLPILRRVMSLAGGLAAGALAVVLARLIRTAAEGGGLTGPDAGLMMMLDFGIAMAVLAILRSRAGMAGRAMGAMQLVGALAMLAVMHNLVHARPIWWSKLFGRDWVLDVLTTTEPGSILLGGISYLI